MLRAAIALTAATLLAGSAARAAPGDWLGAEACASRCHAEVLASWRATAHARGGAPGTRAGCASCHATAPRRLALTGVQCEACHGAGAHYAKDDIMRNPTLARALGLADAAASCVRCHRDPATRVTGFDHAAAWKKVAH